jgi:hypothetical protein
VHHARLISEIVAENADADSETFLSALVSIPSIAPPGVLGDLCSGKQRLEDPSE